MLYALAQLGRIKDQHQESNIKHIISIDFDSSGKYVNSELLGYNENESEKYLYQKDPAGQGPGLFLTGNLPLDNVKKLSDINTHSEFIRKKILWFEHGKIVNNLFDTLNEQRQQELKNIFKEIQDKREQISNDIINILTRNVPEQMLLTITIDGKFPGEIPDYAELFNRGKLSSKGNTEQLVCNICNKLQEVYPYTERSLPFFFSDKTHFFHKGNITRSFPVCKECYTSLQGGTNLIEKRLNYTISSNSKLIPKTKQKKSSVNVRFWLIPFVNNPAVIEQFKNDLQSHNKRLYYLDSLKELCSSLKLINKYDVPENGQRYDDAFLRYGALFYYNDSKAAGIMRLLNYVPNIYPPQLKKLISLKQDIDTRFPFQYINKENNFFIGFPLLVACYKDITPRWDTHVVGILNKMFTDQQIPTSQLIQNINLRIHQTLRYSNDTAAIGRIALSGLMLLEYITELNKHHPYNQETTINNLTMLNISTYETQNLDDFIISHKSILNTETKQGIFAAGVAVAILFHEQEWKYDKTPPFWDKLSRLDLNLQKVMSLTHEVKRLLGAYKIRKHDTIINYIAMKCIEIDPDSDISKDLVSFIFTTGLGFGYFLARGNIVSRERHEEVKNKE